MSHLKSLPPLLLGASLLACGPSETDDCARYTFPLSPAPTSTIHDSCTSPACGDGQNPPTSGPHCGSTVSCRSHDTEQNRCEWIHNLEHGHAVFLYNCPEGCPEVVATLEGLREEARLGANGVKRAMVAPDPTIPNRVAAVLWRRSWLSDTADEEALRCFLRLQDQDAPEPGLACPR